MRVVISAVVGFIVVVVSSGCLVVGFGLDVVLRVVWKFVVVMVEVLSLFVVIVVGATELVSLSFATENRKDNYHSLFINCVEQSS